MQSDKATSLGGYFLLLSRKIIYKSEVNPTRKIPAWMKSVIEIDNEVGDNCEKIISGNFIFFYVQDVIRVNKVPINRTQK